jgi:YD repeat-containing protein
LGGTDLNSTSSGNAVAVDLLGNGYFAGATNSTNFPTANPFQSANNANNGGYNAFVAKIVPSGVLPPAFTAISPDTGYSSIDQITNSQNLMLYGTAPATATVTLYRSGAVGPIGQTTASSSSNATFTYDYSGTTLGEGTYTFTATATLNGVKSASSTPFRVVVDLTPPTVTLTAPLTTTSFAPQVRVTAIDNVGMPPTAYATVTLDVDTNNDGNFTDPGETGYASGNLVNGQVVITVPALQGPGTYPMRARVNDIAGNEGTSAISNVVVTTNPNPWGGAAQIREHDPYDGMPRENLGVVSLSNELDLDRSPGTVQGGSPALVYNSDSADPRPIVQATLTASTSANPPASITATLMWDMAVVTQIYDTTSLHKGDTFTIALPAPDNQTTGRHHFTLTVGTPIPQSFSGVTYVVNQSASQFGAGWTLANVDQLFPIAMDAYGPAGMLWAYGVGGWRFFQDNGNGTFTRPLNDFGQLTLAGGTYTYTFPDNSVETFDGNPLDQSFGRETGWKSTDRFEQLSYAYSAVDGSLTGETAIDGASSTVSVAAGNGTITGINRTYTLANTGTDLTSITNADGGVHSFGYDGSHHMTSETFGLLQNEWAYTTGALNVDTWGSAGSPSTFTLVPAATVGVSAIAIGPVQATDTDVLNDVTAWQLDQRGRPTQEIAADGGVSAWVYNPNGNGLATSYSDPIQRVTGYAYDDKGSVTQVSLPDTAVLTYAYDGNEAMTLFKDGLGNPTNYANDSGGHHTLITDACPPSRNVCLSGGVIP